MALLKKPSTFDTRPNALSTGDNIQFQDATGDWQRPVSDIVDLAPANSLYKAQTSYSPGDALPAVLGVKVGDTIDFMYFNVTLRVEVLAGGSFNILAERWYNHLDLQEFLGGKDTGSITMEDIMDAITEANNLGLPLRINPGQYDFRDSTRAIEIKLPVCILAHGATWLFGDPAPTCVLITGEDITIEGLSIKNTDLSSGQGILIAGTARRALITGCRIETRYPVVEEPPTTGNVWANNILYDPGA